MILGLDPGLRHTGWAILSPHLVDCGVISISEKLPLSQRLASLHKKLIELIGKYPPKSAVVEEIFVNKNPLSTLKLGMARGVVLAAPALFEIPVFEYTANQVKKTISGQGHASKEQVMFMVKQLFPMLPYPLDPNAADALAIAFCHQQHSSLLYCHPELVSGSGSRLEGRDDKEKKLS